MIELLIQAEGALSLGLLDRAETLYRQVASADPQNSIAVVGLARVALERRNEPEALELAWRALAIDPENTAAQRMVQRLEEVLTFRGAELPVERRRPSRRPRPNRRPHPGRCLVRLPRRLRPRRRPLNRAHRSSGRRTGPAHSRLRQQLGRVPSWTACFVEAGDPQPGSDRYRSSMTRVLITGGAGYVGSVSAAAFVEAGHDVVVLDDLTTGHRGAVPSAAVLHEGTYVDGVALARLLEAERIEAILHCAARSVVGESIREPARYFRENVAGGVALLDAARATGVERVVFSSTAAVYGVPESTPIPEDAALRPINPYGETKRAFESALTWYGRAYGLRSVSLRYFNVAGATDALGEDHQPETHLIPNVLGAVEGGPGLTVFGDDYPTPDGTCIRDYIHVSDLAEAHLLALAATAPGDPRTDEPLVCNLGNGDGFSVRQVLSAAEAITGRPVPHEIGPRRTGDAPVLVARSSRAADVLGWRPARPSLEVMVGSAWAWRQAHPGGYEA